MLRARLLQADTVPASIAADSFAADDARAMDKMMSDMSVRRTGDVDRDFVLSMVPHHQGAIDMALAELHYGKDETLRRMAQEIIVEQRQEIDAMRLAEGHLPSPQALGPNRSDICASRSIP
jgi:uncharacterized protein (DUF305 family)